MVADLYYTPQSCGAASYIAAYKAGILGGKLNAYQADIQSHKVVTGPSKGKDFYAINPKGNVPALVLDDRILLNENAATLQWIADQNPGSELAPRNGTPERYLLQSMLSFLSSELNSVMSPLFGSNISQEVKNFLYNCIKQKFQYLSKSVLNNGSKKFLVGDKFTVADAYLYIILSWAKPLNIDIGEYPILKKYYDDIGSMDFVKKAQQEMEVSSS